VVAAGPGLRTAVAEEVVEELYRFHFVHRNLLRKCTQQAAS
jgi:hypothetical protein